jgi:hypothetical protein
MIKNTEFDIEDFINQLIEHQKKTSEVLEHNLNDSYTDDSIIEFFKKVSDRLFINSSVSKKIADYCQLLKKPENFAKITLYQIKNIYAELINIHPLDIGFYESFAWFLNNVLDAPEEARAVLNLGINRISQKMDELKRDVQIFS